MEIEWFNPEDLISKTSDMRVNIWSFSKDLRPNMKLTLRRVKNYTATKSHVENGEEVIDKIGTESFRTELECCGKVLPIAPLKLDSSAEWLLGQWVRQLDPILTKYELNPTPLRPASIDSPDTFVQAITQSTKYKELHQDNV